MDNQSGSHAYLSDNYDDSSESAFTNQRAYQPLTEITQDSNPMRPVSSWDVEHTPERVNQVDQYLNADFEPGYSFADLVQSADDSLSNDEWSQYLAPVANHIQNCEGDGKLLSANPTDVTGTSAFNTVDIDQPQSSTPTSSYTSSNSVAQAAPVQFPNPISNGTSAPSSTRATSSQSDSPAPQTAGQIPNANIDGSRYTCNDCRISAKTKRDWERHCKTNKHKARGNLSKGSSNGSIPGAASTGFHCPVEGCKYHASTGRAITREDNLRRHVKIVHGMDIRRKSEE